ncbi:MAG: hypothetical protein GX196_04600 [Clostridiaceae bacterium]|nr:hypothetical protein [Clostridiaceae bacterium]
MEELFEEGTKMEVPEENEGGDELKEKIRQLEIEKAALIRGVRAKDLDYVVFKVRQKEGEDINTLLDEFLSENPEFLNRTGRHVSTGATHNQNQNKSEEVKRIVESIIKNMA